MLFSQSFDNREYCFSIFFEESFDNRIYQSFLDESKSISDMFRTDF